MTLPEIEHQPVAADICACIALRKATRAVTQYYDAMMKPTGLRTTQYSLLIAVAAQGPIGVTSLARKMSLDQTTLTRNVRVLLSRGFLASAPAPDDRRRRLLRITAAGDRALADALPYWQKAQRRFVAKMGADPWDALLDGRGAAGRMSDAGSPANGAMAVNAGNLSSRPRAGSCEVRASNLAWRLSASLGKYRTE